MIHSDCVIIGGGIVGLSTAYQLQIKHPDWKITLLEKESSLGAHQTGNNSGVIHSGLYYKPGSLKALNCVQGRKLLLEFCQKHMIPYELCGKVVVAVSEDERPRLHALFERGEKNGLQGLRLLTREELKKAEPKAEGVAALLVPETGIIDYLKVCGKFSELIRSAGGEIHCNEKVIGVQFQQEMVSLQTHRRLWKTRFFVNCAGLHSDHVAKAAGLKPQVQIIPFRGEYYVFKETFRNQVKNLIYPVPDAEFPFLGVHFTRMINGEVECGPNAVFAFRREGYTKTSFDWGDVLETFLYPGFWSIAKKHWKMGLGEFYRSFSKKAFVKALQRLMPDLNGNWIVPGGAGVRAQAVTRGGRLVDDFCIERTERGIHVLNAPSPAATASLAIGEKIAEMVG